nr:HlyD family secretion protein [Myxococcota bacterium]
ESLFANGAVSRAEYDARKASFDQAVAEATRAEARLAAARAGLGDSSGSLESAKGRLMAAETAPEQIEAAKAQVSLASARLDQAKAALEQAELNLSFTKIRAETAGVVARRSVEVGQMASPERAMMAIVPLDDTWVVANFKEDQIAEMRPNQRVRVEVDSYSDHDFEGKIDSLAGGTGARFALLPPDNASGNFTKVVQRVPVLIRLDPHPGIELRPGLSATATVYTK